MAILALSLALIWGYGGILCFGQSAFFGLGAYTYAIAMFNIGESTIPLLLAIVLPAALRRAARLFHVLRPDQRRLSRRHHADGDADPVQFGEFHRGSRISYRRGAARRLQRHSGNPAAQSCPATRPRRSISRACSIWRRRRLLATYFGLRLLLASRFGRVIVGIRENERRAELLGYDPRAYKLATFTIGGALAGFAGCLFANWGDFVSPTIFGLAQSAQIIIWVIVGGRGTLIGPIVGCIGIQWLTTALGANQPSGSDWWPKLLANAPLVFGHPHRVRAAGAEGVGADARRCRPMAAAAAYCGAAACGGLNAEQRGGGRDGRAAASRPAISACASAASMRYATSTSRWPKANCAA